MSTPHEWDYSMALQCLEEHARMLALLRDSVVQEPRFRNSDAGAVLKSAIELYAVQAAELVQAFTLLKPRPPVEDLEALRGELLGSIQVVEKGLRVELQELAKRMGAVEEKASLALAAAARAGVHP